MHDDNESKAVMTLIQQSMTRNQQGVSFTRIFTSVRNADPEKVALLILQKKKQIENARDMETIERLYTELDALEWLQRQVVVYVA